MLNTAVKAARRAGAIINRASLNLDRVSVSTKGPGDYVTDIDRVAEEEIIQILSDAYPDHAFVFRSLPHIGCPMPRRKKGCRLPSSRRYADRLRPRWPGVFRVAFHSLQPSTIPRLIRENACWFRKMQNSLDKV